MITRASSSESKWCWDISGKVTHLVSAAEGLHRYSIG
jgi:hypothetical protein